MGNTVRLGSTASMKKWELYGRRIAATEANGDRPRRDSQSRGKEKVGNQISPRRDEPRSASIYHSPQAKLPGPGHSDHDWNQKSVLNDQQKVVAR